jgi:8-oxo-dGTP pyrophosphatase MutT (NUDIX family)
LLRDGAAGLEVLMTVRHERSGFAGGALVFPGGKLDSEDSALHRYAAGSAAADPLLDYRICAIRETFEESGILLARKDGAMLSGPGLAALQSHRDEAGAPLTFAALLGTARLELATDIVLRFAHWITPVDRPQRFDTQFFVAAAPAGQKPAHDGREIVEAIWLTPQAALAGAAQGRFKLVFATHVNLAKLGESDSVAAVLERAAREVVHSVTPEVVKTEAGPLFRIPPGAGYAITELVGDKLVRP